MRKVALMVAVVVSGFFGYSYAQAQSQGPIVTPAACTADADWTFRGTSSRSTPGDVSREVSFCLKGVLLTADEMKFTQAADGSRVFQLDGKVTLTMPPDPKP